MPILQIPRSLCLLLVLPWTATLEAQVIPPLPKNPFTTPKNGAGNQTEPTAPAAEVHAFANTFADAETTLELQWDGQKALYRGTLTHNGQRMPCQGSERGGKLVGTFTSNGDNFEFSLEKKGAAYVFSTAGQQYQLQARNGAGEPARPGQPAPTPAGGPATGGVGIAFQPDQAGNLVIAQLAPDGPASRAKVPTGAVLRAVDGKRTAGLSLEEVRGLITGPIGSMVTLTLETDREVIDVLLQRAALNGGPAPNQGNPGPAVDPRQRPDGPGGVQPNPGTPVGNYPSWLQVGMRASYFSGSATLPGVSTQLVEDDQGGWVDGRGQHFREEQVMGTGGGGFTQYDFVEVSPECLGVNQTTFVYADAQLQTVSRVGSQGLTGDQNGLGDLWLPPARLRAMQEQDSGGLRVRRVRYPLDGHTYDAITTQTKAQGSYTRYTYDLDTGLMLIYSSATTGAAVLTPNGNTATNGAGAQTIAQVRLRNLRPVRLPWTGQKAPQWLQQGQQFHFTGTFANSLSEGLLAPWRYDLQLAIDRRIGECTVAKLSTRLDYGNGQPQDSQSTKVMGPGTFANLYLDPQHLRGLQQGQVFDQDPITGWRCSFAGSNGQTATILEQGPLEQQSYTYDLQNGQLVGTSLRQQSGPAVLSIELQLQRR